MLKNLIVFFLLKVIKGRGMQNKNPIFQINMFTAASGTCIELVFRILKLDFHKNLLMVVL